MATVLTNVGEQWICDFLSGTVATDADWIGMGTGGTTAAKGDTALGTEVETRDQGTMSTSGSGASAKYQVVGTITATGSRAVIEAGLFTASTSGTMVIRGDFSTINLSSGDSIQFTFTLDPS